MCTGDHLAGQLSFDRVGAERKRDDPTRKNKADGRGCSHDDHG